MGYRGKVEEQERARALRAEGWTMPDIAAELGVARSSVSLWTRDVPFTPGPRRSRERGPNVLQRRKADEIERLRVEGSDIVGHLSDRDLLIAGTALYAGEGDKRDGSVGFTNSDPRMIDLFCRWLRTCSARTHRAIMGLVDALLPLLGHSGVAQSVEQGTVNAKVLGSSPSPGAHASFSRTPGAVAQSVRAEHS